MILRQEHRSARYTFDPAWGLPGGPLYGDNFFSDICALRTPPSEIAQCVNGVWVITDCAGDPDFLMYLWKKGREESVGAYVEMDEMLYLYRLYNGWGFPCMIPEITFVHKKENQCCIL